MVPWILSAAQGSNKSIDRVRVQSDFVRPLDIATQLTRKDFCAFFGINYDDLTSITDSELHNQLKGLGEVDAHVSMTFYAGNNKITRVALSALHHGYSERTQPTLSTKPDELYQHSGRVKDETCIIYQGPFQKLHLVMPQDVLIPNIKGCLSLKVHPNLPQPSRPKIPIYQGTKFRLPVHGKLIGADASRASAFDEFMGAIRGEISSKDMVSKLRSHEQTVQLFSAAYQSAAREYCSENPSVDIPLTF